MVETPGNRGTQRPGALAFLVGCALMIYQGLSTDQPRPTDRYERQDVGVTAIVSCLFGLGVLIFSVLVLVRAGLRPDSLQQFERSSRAGLNSLTAIQPPEPRLTARPALERSAWLQQAAIDLAGGAATPGKRRLPIRDAMQQLVRQGAILRTIPLQPKVVPASPETQQRPTAGDAP